MGETTETASSVEKRLLKLEVDSGVTKAIVDFEKRVNELESMVKTARYTAIVAGAVISIVGILVTRYVSSLTSKFDTANNEIATTTAFIQKTKQDLEDTQAKLTASEKAASALEARTAVLSAKTQENASENASLQKTFDGLIKRATAEIQGSAKDALSAAIRTEAATLLAAIPEFQTQTTSDLRKLKTDDAKYAEQIKALGDHITTLNQSLLSWPTEDAFLGPWNNGGNCPSGYYMVGANFHKYEGNGQHFYDNAQIVCRQIHAVD